jgi:glycosyltransferase involved in cell wall biosynthesis
LRIALVHDWLTTYAGADKVLAEIAAIYPDADIFTLVEHLSPEDRLRFKAKEIHTSFLQSLPFSRLLYRHLIPLMPLAMEQHDLSSYDVIISNSHAVAKGVITGPDQLHICYCYTPIRYAWDFQHQYLVESHLTRGVSSLIVRYVLHRLRIWDTRTSNGVDHFVACSQYIARRIWKAYRRDSAVIYPFVSIEDFVISQDDREQYYMTSSRLVPYKKIQLIVEAFAAIPDRTLIVIGAGPLLKRIRSMATSNVIVLGYQPYAQLLRHLQRARAFIFASEEDFGIAPLEALACGTPVLAYGRGGGGETIIDGVTGLHFWSQTTAAIVDVIGRFELEPAKFDPQNLRAHAKKFSAEIFKKNFADFVNSKIEEHRLRIPGIEKRLNVP